MSDVDFFQVTEQTAAFGPDPYSGIQGAFVGDVDWNLHGEAKKDSDGRLCV